MNSTFYFTCLLIMVLRTLSFSIYPDSICVGKQCNEKGIEVNKSFHSPKNACENFYKFSCGAWISQAEKPPFEVLWNHWHQASHYINAKIRVILEGKSSDGPAIRKARFMYQTCSNAKKDYTDELLLFCDAMGGWAIGDDSVTLIEYNWPLKIAQIIRIVKVHPLLKLHVDLDYRSPSKYLIYIDSGDLIMPNYILERPEIHVKDLAKYKEWIIKTVNLLYPRKTLRRLNEDVDDMIALEVRLAKMATINSPREMLTVQELNERTNTTNWLQIFNVLFDGSGIEIRSHNFIAVSFAFINRLVQFLETVNPKIVANYVMWHLIKELSRDASSNLKYENFRINGAILGIEEDYPVHYECAAKVAEYFQFAIARRYAELFISINDVRQVKRMSAEIKSEFVAMLKMNAWLSKRAIEKAIEKVASVKIFIGFPKWIADRRAVESLYRKIRITDNHFLNVIHLKERFAKYSLQKLTLTARNRWPSNLFDVNGYYNPLQNSIIISLGLLQKPFFNMESAAAFNYGAMGSLIGHELSHSLDEFAKELDKSATTEWWANSDAKKYNSRLACFREHYNGYNVDGQQTIMENIADNVGLELSFRAFRRNRKVDRTIPFLENYSWDQLFFIGYAQMWCEVMGSNDEFINQEEHAPVQFRVRGVVSNNVNYRKTFGCGSDIENDACILW